MKKFLISYLAGLATVSLFLAFIANAQSISSPNYWRTNIASSTITPINTSLQVPCANIVGGCSGGSGSSTIIYAGNGILVNASGTNGYVIINNGVTSTLGNWAGTWQGTSSSTFYLASNPSGFISSAPATTTVNGTQAAQFFLNGGSGITSTVSGATTTFNLNLGAGCSGNQFVATISATGTITCATPTGGASSTNVFGTNGVSVTQTGVNATATLDTSYAASWSALETFLNGIFVNGTTTLASTTSALLKTNASGTVSAYAGASACPSDEAVTTISALGATTCSTAFVPQTTSVSTGGILSGGGALSSNQTISLSTSTLYSQFSAVAPITFNTSTGALGWTNSNNYITLTSLSASSPLSYNNSTGAFTCPTCSTLTTSTLNGLYVLKANNLSDLASTSTARTNLGLGSAATHAASDFLQTSNNLSDVANSSTARTNLGLTATSSLVLSDANGIQTSYGGTSCGFGTVIKSISATGTATCSSAGSGGVATTTPFGAGYLPVVSSSLALTNSSLYQSSNGDLSVGTTTDSGALNVVGTTTLQNAATIGGALTASSTVGIAGNLSVGTSTTSTFQIYAWSPTNQTSTVMIGATSTATSTYRTGCLEMTPSQATGTTVVYATFQVSSTIAWQLSTSTCL
ncbi:MAG: hypothetical protein KGL39_14820 [Patescibacteria group bacterium]|nr:hypothetical protein [Patescibacteria group bacterium]